ncbi:MAG: phosphoribosylformylglycinamidine cyclo-ligase [Sulfobacillus thermotolerans]|uniref:Phosphoribosylformylglycinamidine cyclo-ligase n=1 Tax=Sulfobacillus thermotolerans TaxID=338644 RepID=A0ABM6RRT5_9FIRM|nr:phosphoribosylformylglycinamidine cyclo-ligase [Sulfobacillus thermotolerans]MCY0909155.1 phosphoribosylformylglycinamidine cyclo-ligase [Sulfobacillus thermotolerans]
MPEPKRPMNYRDAGVDIDQGNEAVKKIRPWAEKTQRPEVLAGVGGFAGAFAWNQAGVLLAGADGVGSKLLLAQQLNKLDTIGIDLVAMNVNDILAQGGEPLFFLDYIATHRVIPEEIETVVAGIAQGCLEAGCALLGGETAELPDLYAPGHFDLAGFAVGHQRYVPPALPEPGDVVLGLASSGFHSNGYQLVRRIIADNGVDLNAPLFDDNGVSWGSALLTPTRIYVKAVRALWDHAIVKAMAHITGGGLVDNLPRTLPEGVAAVIRKQSWPILPLMSRVAEMGCMEDQEFYRTFNAGIGFTVVVAPDRVGQAQTILAQHQVASYPIGRITQGQGVVWE